MSDSTPSRFPATAAPIDAGVADTAVLVARSQRGDAQSLEEVLCRYWRRVLRVVRSRTRKSLRRTSGCQDLVQETLMQAVRAWSRFRMHDRSSLMRWLATIAEHQIRGHVDYLSAARRRGTADLADHEIRDAAPGVVELAAAVETRQRLQSAIAALPALQRRIVHLRCELGWPWRRIAAAVGKPSADAARATFGLARRRLSRAIADDPE